MQTEENNAKDCVRPAGWLLIPWKLPISPSQKESQYEMKRTFQSQTKIVTACKS